MDLRQIEPRVTLHYCTGRDAEAAKARFWENPEMDSYQPMVDALPDYTRKMLKRIWLGLTYGMGVGKTARQLGMTPQEGKSVINEFNATVPYYKSLFNRAKDVADARGYIRTIMGRKRRFNTYEPAKFGHGKPSLPYEDAVREYGHNIQRAFCYKALNSLIQGGSADIMKKIMVDSWEAGIYDILIPHVTVHDEVGVSKPKNKMGDEAVKELDQIVKNVWPELTVPLASDIQFGANWGEIR